MGKRGKLRRIALAALLVALGVVGALGTGPGCAARKSKLGGLALDMLEELPETREIATQFEKYNRVAAKLKKFHDTGTLEEDDILDVLKTGGVIAGAPKRSGGQAPSGKRVPPPVENYGGGYRWPLDAGVVSSEFGGRWGKQHKGLDVAADLGVPVKASASGVVIYADSTMRGYGNALVVRHDSRFTTLYAHNQKLLVRSGAQVTQGQTIAYLGSTGHSTGPHVHFEIRDGDTPLPPRQKLVKSRF